MRSRQRIAIAAKPRPEPATAPPVRSPSAIALLQRRIGNAGLRSMTEERRTATAPTRSASGAPVSATAVAPAASASPTMAEERRTGTATKRAVSHAPIVRTASVSVAALDGPATTASRSTRGTAPSAAGHGGKAQAHAAASAIPEKASQGGETETAPDRSGLIELRQHVAQIARRQKQPGDSKAMAAHTRKTAVAMAPEGQSRAATAALDVLEKSGEDSPGFETEQFKKALKERLAQSIPDGRTSADAQRAVDPETGVQIAGAMKGELSTTQRQAVGDMPVAAATPADPNAFRPDPPPLLFPTAPGARPAMPSAAGAVPEKLPDQALDTSADRADADAQLASQDLTQDQLKTSKEPSFVDAAETRDAAEKHAAEGPSAVRAAEGGARDQARAHGASTLRAGVGAMFGDRAVGFLRAFAQQNVAKSKEEEDRARVARDLDKIQKSTRDDVLTTLKGMETSAVLLFEVGLQNALAAFDAERDRMEAAIRQQASQEAQENWDIIGDLFARFGDLDERQVAWVIREARKAYNLAIDKAIDDVARFVGPILLGVKQRIARGKREAATYVDGLTGGVALIGAEELERINTEFDTLSTEVEARRDAMIGRLGESYATAQKAVEARAQAFRDANKSWWEKLKDKVRGVIRAIVQIKDMFLTVLAKISNVVGTILRDPGGFLDNLVSAVGRGLTNFVSNFLTYLKEGFFEWLFGTAAKAGIKVPKTFDAAGIFGLLASVLGLTQENVRARAVAKVGEGPVSALEKGAGILMVLKDKGLAGLWDMLVEKLTAMKDAAIEQVQSMLTTEVIGAGIKWVIGLLNPAAGFIKACKAIYEIVKFFVNNWERIFEFVNSVIDSIGAIAKGQIDAAAALVEKTLARTIPVIIGFLASLLGLGDIADKVKKIIERIQAPVNKAIDWLIDKAVGLVKAGAGLVAKTAKGVFNWVKAKVGFKDADGKSHSIYVAPGPHPQLLIASDPLPATQFLDLYIARKAAGNKDFKATNAKEIKAAYSAADMSQKIVDEIAALNRDTSKEPSGKEMALLQQLLAANVTLSQKLSDLVGRDASVAGAVQEKYLLEGVTGTYESIPKPKGDQLTADHQPQAAVLEECAEFDYFDESGNLHKRAAKRAAKGFAINLHFKRHVAGRTFGGKGGETKRKFVELAEKVKSKPKVKQPKAVVDLIRDELRADYEEMIRVADDDKNYPDITGLPEKELPEPDKKILIKEIKGRIKAGEREMLAQDLDSLIT